MVNLTVTQKSVLTHGYERATADFSDGSNLVFIPYKGLGGIGGLMGMGLYQERQLTAAVVDRRFRNMPSESQGFWSRSEEAKQTMLAGYIALAADEDTNQRYNEIVRHSKKWIRILKEGNANSVDKPDFLDDFLR